MILNHTGGKKKKKRKEERGRNNGNGLTLFYDWHGRSHDKGEKRKKNDRKKRPQLVKNQEE